MQKLFTKILVPVAFNRNTRWAIDKAVQLANKFDCDILLLHVQTPPSTIQFLSKTYFSDFFSPSSRNNWEVKIKELESKYRPKLKEGLMMASVTLVGSWQSVIREVIIAEHIDLALIPRSHKRLNRAVIRYINIDTLALQTSCPIMTITRNFNANQLQNIVVPIFDLLPVKKLAMATYLTFETSGCIYLMGRDDSISEKTENRYLMKAYQLLNGFSKLNIQCSLQGDEDTAGATLAFAKNVKANLIVVNPGKESRLTGLWNNLRGKYLFRESDIPVLTVS